ncbi:membrane protein ORF25A [Cyprinid herpesvirus 1]|uniref:Membrane protein ORF25A n=1 Tax=Cyprinid herpesvirus 1 TaxID=317858 RepID=K7PC50_9VIRU|nr:membrane protein ORF25A [Cyprinid herpesvirus 1]AFJ20327.1 membrane protein ORF25A [Cyprinid herpesvirus 1]
MKVFFIFVLIINCSYEAAGFYTVEYYSGPSCAVNGRPFTLYAKFRPDNLTVTGITWIVKWSSVTIHAESNFVGRISEGYVRVPSRYNDTYLGRVELKPFMSGDEKFPFHMRMMGLTKPPNEGPTGYTYKSKMTIKLAEKPSITVVGFADFFSGGKTTLECVQSCRTGVNDYNWFMDGNFVISVTNNSRYSTAIEGRYSCEINGTSGIPSDPVWVGSPVYDCPFDAAQWCQDASIVKMRGNITQNVTADDLRQFGNVLVCNNSRAVSTRGMCPNRTVCNMDAYGFQCASHQATIITDCQKTTKYCPKELGFSMTSAKIIAHSLNSELLSIDGVGETKVFCGTDTEIYTPCSTNTTRADITTFNLFEKAPVWIRAPTTTEVMFLNVGDVFNMTCPKALMVAWFKNTELMSVVYGYDGNPMMVKTLMEADIEATWNCISFPRIGSNGNRTRLIYITSPPPTTTTTTTVTTTPSTVAPTTPTTTVETTTITLTTTTVETTTIAPAPPNTPIITTAETTTTYPNTTTTTDSNTTISTNTTMEDLANSTMENSSNTTEVNSTTTITTFDRDVAPVTERPKFSYKLSMILLVAVAAIEGIMIISVAVVFIGVCTSSHTQ